MTVEQLQVTSSGHTSMYVRMPVCTDTPECNADVLYLRMYVPTYSDTGPNCRAVRVLTCVCTTLSTGRAHLGAGPLWEGWQEGELQAHLAWFFVYNKPVQQWRKTGRH